MVKNIAEWIVLGIFIVVLVRLGWLGIMYIDSLVDPAADKLSTYQVEFITPTGETHETFEVQSYGLPAVYYERWGGRLRIYTGEGSYIPPNCDEAPIGWRIRVTPTREYETGSDDVRYENAN